MTPPDPDYAARVARGFKAQGFMALLGAELISVAPGVVEIALPLRPALSQHHGYAHAGATWAIADTAAGFAAQTLMAAADGVLTVEVKINLLSPAKGARLIARGTVERAGRRLTVARADVVAVAEDGRESAVALALGTFMTLPGLADAD
ncbi:MAG: PaaI family thioesterase [Alphaproteobacteria bacterium]|nr:PaaI family thioesterase [Alphaproteobacteria bacterium]